MWWFKPHQDYSLIKLRVKWYIMYNHHLTDARIWLSNTSCGWSSWRGYCPYMAPATCLQCFDSWHCWLGSRKSIWPVKNWVMSCWCGYLSGARCKMTCICSSWWQCHTAPSSLLYWNPEWSFFWNWLTQVVVEKRPLHKCCICKFTFIDQHS